MATNNSRKYILAGLAGLVVGGATIGVVDRANEIDKNAERQTQLTRSYLAGREDGYKDGKGDGLNERYGDGANHKSFSENQSTQSTTQNARMYQDFEPVKCSYIYTDNDSRYKVAAIEVYFNSSDHIDVLGVFDMRNIRGVQPYSNPLDSATFKALAYRERGAPFYVFTTEDAEKTMKHDRRKKIFVESMFSPTLLKNRTVLHGDKQEWIDWGDATELLEKSECQSYREEKINSTSQPFEPQTIVFPHIKKK